MSSQPIRRFPLARLLVRIALGVVCGVVGFGMAFGAKLLLVKPASDETADATHDDHDDHPDEHATPPTHQQLNVAVRSGNYAAGLKLARGLLGEGHGDHAEHDAHASHPDPQVRYALALCLEGLGRWEDALEAYEALAADAPAGVQAVAACGEVRCHLAEGNTAEATGALVRAERAAAGVPGLATELDYLRGRVALKGVPKFTPGPFSPDEPMGAEPTLAPADYADWLKLPTSAGGDAVSPPATTSATDPILAAGAAFAAVLAADPPHPDEAAVRLTVANLLFRGGRTDEAAREYKRLREGHPAEVVQVAAMYNLGLIRHRKGEWAVARQLLADAADLGAHTPAAGVAWWWAGRCELDAGNVDSCRTLWTRAGELGDREAFSAALLGRAFLLLLDGETERAGKVLHGQRLANRDPIPAVGEVVECYLRYADRPTELKRNELIAAVHHAEFGKPFGPAGQVLIGGWLGEAGEGKEMLVAYEAASETARGIWAVRLTLGTAEHLYAAGDTKVAASRFTAVAAADGGEYGDRARLRLAEIALAAGRADECVRFCRVILKREHEDRTTVLRLLGRGYEQLNRPRAAAECFAGRLPTP